MESVNTKNGINLKDSVIVNPFTHFGLDVYAEMKLYEINIPRSKNAIKDWHNTFTDTFGSSRFSFLY